MLHCALLHFSLTTGFLPLSADTHGPSCTWRQCSRHELETGNPGTSEGTSEWAVLILYGATFAQTTTPLLTALGAVTQAPKRAYDKRVMAHTRKNYMVSKITAITKRPQKSRPTLFVSAVMALSQESRPRIGVKSRPMTGSLRL